MALFNRNRFCAFVSAFMLSAVLAGCGVNGGLSQNPDSGGGGGGVNNSGGGGGGGDTTPRTPIFDTGTPTAAELTGAGGDDVFTIAGDATGGALTINSVIDGAGGNNVLQLDAGAVVTSVAFSDQPPPSGDVLLQNIQTIRLNGGRVTNSIDASAAAPTGVIFDLRSGLAGSGDIFGSSQNDVFIISGNVVSSELDVDGLIQGRGGDRDEVRLIAGASVRFLDYANFARTDISMRSIEILTIDGGTVTNSISASNTSNVPAGGITFNLISGTVAIAVDGSSRDDTFNLGSGINIGGVLNGGGGTDVLRYAGAPSGIVFIAGGRGGLAGDGNITDTSGDVQRFESQVDDPAITSLGAGGLRGAFGFEVLELAPALNLYGALSDALMQFGAQTAQGVNLADLNLATGRATQLVSKDSPFSKGRIWAHKITHSGNGKGSIGLGLTGLTARADNDYDYEMSLTQHGFDAPVATTKLGAFNLRAVSHTMTGTIETNIAEAKVSGYGAGLALQWRGQNLVAHLTSLAGAYEVEATTSSLNPRAVVSEVSEGSFSAINAVVSAGVADTRKLSHSLVLRTTADIVWQTLSLDDFNETGADGIIINFDKATRFTARVGAGLESEHWFSDVVFVHETSSGGTLSSGLSQDYRQDDGTAIEMKLGGKIADLATGLTLKAYAGLRTSLIGAATLEPSGHLALNWRF